MYFRTDKWRMLEGAEKQLQYFRAAADFYQIVSKKTYCDEKEVPKKSPPIEWRSSCVATSACRKFKIARTASVDTGSNDQDNG